MSNLRKLTSDPYFRLSAFGFPFCTIIGIVRSPLFLIGGALFAAIMIVKSYSCWKTVVQERNGQEQRIANSNVLPMSEFKVKKILTADDGSPEGQRAFQAALWLAISLNADLILFGVVPQENIDPMTGPPGYNPNTFRRKMEDRFWKFRKFGDSMGLDVDIDLVDGRPAEEIQKRAIAEHADLIVVGRRKKSGFKRLLEGSTSDAIIRNAHCSVMIIR